MEKKMLFDTGMFIALPCTARSQTSLRLTTLILFIPCDTVKWKTHVRATNACYLVHTASTSFGLLSRRLQRSDTKISLKRTTIK